MCGGCCGGAGGAIHRGPDARSCFRRPHSPQAHVYGDGIKSWHGAKSEGIGKDRRVIEKRGRENSNAGKGT